MGVVVKLRAKAPEESEAVEVSGDIHSRMRQGKLTGLFYMACGPGVEDEMGICGEFADDLEYAKRAALAGFAALFGHSLTTPVQRPYPRGLKGST